MLLLSSRIAPLNVARQAGMPGSHRAAIPRRIVLLAILFVWPGSAVCGQPEVSVSEAWHRAAEQLRFEQLSPEVVEKLKLTLADCLGAMVYTSAREETRQFADALADSARDEATELVTGRRVSIENAAAVNAFAIHGHEIDDSNLRNQLRASCVALPAPWAMAESRHASGKQLLVALAISYQFSDRLANALNAQPEGKLHRRGWMPSSICGAVGATAAAATLARLDRDRWVSALGLAAGDAGGTFQYYAEGSDEKKLHVARSQRLACESVRLAERGFRGARFALEGPAGLIAALGFETDVRALSTEVEKWDAVEYLKPKFYSCSQGVIPWLELLEPVARQRRWSAAEIDSIELSVAQPSDSLYVQKINAFRPPATLLDAQFSVNFGLALLLARGSAFVDDYTAERLTDAEVLALAAKVRAVSDPPLAGRVRFSAGGNSRELQADLATVYGPYRAVPADYRAKFDRLTQGRLSAGEREALWRHALAIDSAADVAAWTAALVELMKLR